ncbi:HutD family protein [Streptomyces sp. NPDC007076]|uniref:HutD/Ves family protein n=1 Tax=unclassified Streptomyces TaxID=2593676 RepID=UPI002E75D440|nr:HutD family protein [Streptomyces sp. JV190]MEE1842239.1 HutD family protein [Streptomyces sp. JV190]
MTARVLRAADRAATPWKNGGGVTREIAAYPEGAPLDAFDWRVSLAEVDGDGPFSSFPGVDRTLTVVEGAGMDLLVGGEHHILDEPYWPHDFPGDPETEGRLLGGPVVNVNVMCRRGRTSATVAVVRGTVRLAAPPGGAALAIALEDGAVLDATDIALDRYDALLTREVTPGVLRTHGWALLVTLSES